MGASGEVGVKKRRVRNSCSNGFLEATAPSLNTNGSPVAALCLPDEVAGIIAAGTAVANYATANGTESVEKD
ncbi:MAG: hypothetical protein ABGZ53_22215 [Fuerstiella sp.]